MGGYTIFELPDREAAIALAKTWPGHAVEVRSLVEQRDDQNVPADLARR